MEEAIQKAGRSKYGHDHDIRALIDRKTGDIELKRYREVVENGAEIENELAQMSLMMPNVSRRMQKWRIFY